MFNKFLLFLFLINIHLTSIAQEKKYPENFGDVFNSKKFLLGRNIFKGDIGYSFSKVSYEDTVGVLQNFYRNSARINFFINPWKEFYIRNTFFIDFKTDGIPPPWLSDYFYQIGYYNWRNKTFSFGYENYRPNRWNTIRDEFFNNLKWGYFFVSFNYIIESPEGKKLMPLFWDKTSKIVITPFVRTHLEYPDEFNNVDGKFKPITGSNIRYVIIKNIYIEAGLYYYPVKESKLPWDPDFTYGFGIFDWRAFKINASYGNWIANRFPWNEKELKYYGFMNGDFNVNVTYSW